MSEERLKVDISALAIVKVFLVAIAFVLLYWVRDVILMIFISLILAAAFQPVIKSWSKKIGKTLAVLLLLSIFVLILVGLYYMVVPLLVDQVKQLVQDAPSYIDKFNAFRDHTPSIQNWLDQIAGKLSSSVPNVIGFTTSIIGGIVSFITVIILTIYFLIDEQSFSSLGQNVLSGEKKDDFLAVLRKVSVKIGNWLRGQLLLCFVIGAIVYIGLLIIGVPYALTLAVVSGILEIVPIVGPVISGIVAAILAYSVSPVLALIVIGYFIIVQQLENNLLVPKIMQRAIGLPPAIIIVGILVMGNLMGTIGALLAVPVLGIIYVLFEERKAIKEVFSK